MTTLTQLQIEQLKRIEVVLTNMGCAYAIREPDGTMRGDIGALTKKDRKRAPMQYPRGTIRSYLRPFFENMKDGEAVIVPYGMFKPSQLQSGIASYLSDTWGRKTYISTMRNELGGIEVLRSGGI